MAVAGPLPFFFAILIFHSVFAAGELRPAPTLAALEVEQPLITPGPKIGLRFLRGLEERQDTCATGQTQCGGSGCAYDCCDATAGWGCSISGEQCFTSSGYVGCCSAGSSCAQKTICYNHPSGQYCDQDSGTCTTCNSDYPYCVTEINALNSNYVLYCATSTSGIMVVTGAAASSATASSAAVSVSASISTPTSSSNPSSSKSPTSTTSRSIASLIRDSTSTLPHTTITPLTTTSHTTHTDDDDDDDDTSGLSAAAIAGISIGVFFALSLLGLAGFYFCCRRRREEKFYEKGPPIVPAPNSELSNHTSYRSSTGPPPAGAGYVSPRGFGRGMAPGYYGYTERTTTGEQQYSELDGWGVKRSTDTGSR
ncbi:hypothetical protein RUND412_010496 [Rhizina undulata]